MQDSTMETWRNNMACNATVKLAIQSYFTHA